MDDQEFETCQIRRLIKSGAFSTTVSFVAEKSSITGNEVIARSPKVVSRFNGFVWTPTPRTLLGELAAELHQQVLSQLLAEGWEPAGTDKDGKVMFLKRRVEIKSKALKPEKTELLKQLAALRDAGVLTNAEYEEKKKAILEDYS
jgi:hypothetical protein